MLTGLLAYKGGYDASSGDLDGAGGADAVAGDTWTVTVAGTLNGVAVEIDDMIVANSDAPTQADDWDICTPGPLIYRSRTQECVRRLQRARMMFGLIGLGSLIATVLLVVAAAIGHWSFVLPAIAYAVVGAGGLWVDDRLLAAMKRGVAEMTKWDRRLFG